MSFFFFFFFLCFFFLTLIHIYIYTYIYICIYIYIYVYVCIYVCIYMYMICICVCVYIYIYIGLHLQRVSSNGCSPLDPVDAAGYLEHRFQPKRHPLRHHGQQWCGGGLEDGSTRALQSDLRQRNFCGSLFTRYVYIYIYLYVWEYLISILRKSVR